MVASIWQTCFVLELSEKKKKEKKIFLMFLFHSLLVESMDMEPVEMEGRLHAHILSLCVLNK